MPSTLTVVFFIFLQLTQNIGCYAECHCESRSNRGDSVEDTAGELVKNGIKTAIVGGVAVLAAPFVLTAAGFGAGGILAGSYAAGIQSAWFGQTISGLSGQVFSTLQSIGAGGLGLASKAVIKSSTGTVVKIYDSVTGEKCDC